MFRRFQMLTICLVVMTIFAFPQACWVQAQTQEKASSKAEIKRQWDKAGWEFESDWTPVTDEDNAKTWGEGFAKAITEDDLKLAKEFVDFDSLFDRCVNGIDSPAFRKGFTEGAAVGGRDLIARLAQEGSSYEFRGVKQTEYGAGVLMRMLDPNGGCNYHIWHLMKNSDGKLVGVNIYIFLSGEAFGDTMRRIALLSAPKGERTFFQKLVGAEKEMAKNQVALMDMLKASQSGDVKTILKTYDTLPNSLKREKFILISRMTSASQVGGEEYIKSIEDIKKYYPDDPGVDLATMDLYYINKEYDEMRDGLDRIQKVVGADAHLLTLQGVAYFEEEKYDKAIEILKDAVRTEPKYESAYWNAVKTSLAKKDFDFATKVLKSIVKNFGYNQFDFTTDPMYKPFIGSDQHKEFEAFLKEKNAGK